MNGQFFKLYNNYLSQYWHRERDIMSENYIDTGTSQLLAEIREGVPILTSNRPESRNTLGDTITPAIRSLIEKCDANPDVRAFLITGSGNAFCAGGDIKALGQPRLEPRPSRNEAIATLAQRQRTLTGALVASRKPSVAALPGPAIGADLSLALACDIRIAARSAFVRTAYAKIGLTGDYGIAWLLTRIVGPAKARELMLLSRNVGATECARIGLVNQTVEDEKIFDAALNIALELANSPQQALGQIKDNLDDALSLSLVEAERMVDRSGSSESLTAIRSLHRR